MTFNQAKYYFNYRGGEITTSVEAKTKEEAYQKLMEGKGVFCINHCFLHNEFWEMDNDCVNKNSDQNKYKILIKADILSTLTVKQVERQLVASLYNIDTQEKISDSDSKRFEVLDYYITKADKI